MIISVHAFSIDKKCIKKFTGDGGFWAELQSTVSNPYSSLDENIS